MAVEEAIRGGVAQLRRYQGEDGSFRLSLTFPRPFEATRPRCTTAWQNGYNALCVYTLAVCGAEKEDPALVLGFRGLRRDWALRRQRAGITTYFVSLTLLALAETYAPPALPLVGRSTSSDKTEPDWVETMSRELTQWLLARQCVSRYPEGSVPEQTSVSRSKRHVVPLGGFGHGTESAWVPSAMFANTHATFHAAMGLSAAIRLRCEDATEGMESLLDYLVKGQEEDGAETARVDAPRLEATAGVVRSRGRPAAARARARGWAYRAISREPGKGKAAVAMPTAACVAALLLGREVLDDSGGLSGEERLQVTEAARDGLAWLANLLHRPPHSEAAKGDELPLQDFQFLQALGVACRMSGTREIGGVDWYQEGVGRILAERRPDGAFVSSGNEKGRGCPGIDTCFALLFLRQ